MTSIDMNDDASLLREAKMLSPGEETIVSRSLGVAPGAGQPEPTNVVNPSIAGPDDKTRIALSNSGFELNDSPSGIEHMSKTNFTEVQDDDRRRSSIVIASEEPDSQWTHWVSVAGLGAVLLSCAFGIYWFSLPPSANTLYGAISAAIETTDDEILLEAEPEAIRFQELYPDDARNAEVSAVLSEIRSIRSIRQLQRKAKRSGTDQLDPVEQAFLDCIQTQSTDTKAAQRKLNALATVFSASDKLSQKQQQLVDLAKKMSDRIASQTKTERNPAIESLEEQMTWAEANLTPAARIVWLQGLVELFDGKAWAMEIVASAKQKLASLTSETKNKE
jgi:hypothetical protein